MYTIYKYMYKFTMKNMSTKLWELLTIILLSQENYNHISNNLCNVNLF